VLELTKPAPSAPDEYDGLSTHSLDAAYETSVLDFAVESVGDDVADLGVAAAHLSVAIAAEDFVNIDVGIHRWDVGAS
jgi:hypothetical protein